MSLRALMHEKPVVGYGVVVVLLALAGWIAFGGVGGAGAKNGSVRWFYDMETGQLIEHAAGMEHIPPITLENGHEAVSAYVFACGKCDDGASHQLGYVEKFTEKGKQQQLDPPTVVDFDSVVPGMPGGQSPEPSRLVAVPGDEMQWVGVNTPAGMRLVNDVRYRLCPDGSAVECVPGQ